MPSMAHVRRLRAPLALTLSCLLFATQAWAASPLSLANRLLEDLRPENNSYEAKSSYIQWAGIDGKTTSENRSVCSTFYSLLLEKAYGVSSDDLRVWLGRGSPVAENYYDAIIAEDGFQHIRTIDKVQPGDLLAVKYLDEDRVTTGHVAIVSDKPREIPGNEPQVPGTRQFELEIIDSALSGHGPTDTRLMTDGSWDDGVGRGIMRIYTDAQGRIRGYAWSTYDNSEFRGFEDAPISVGRLQLNDLP